MKGVILDRLSLGKGLDLSKLESLGTWTSHDSTKPSETASRIVGADVILTNKVEVTADHMAQNPGLKYIGILATGTNNVNLEAAREFGVKVQNVEDYCSDSLAQHWLSLLLALTNQTVRYHNAVQKGQWSQSPFFCFLDFPLETIADRSLLIVGHGVLGQAVAKLAARIGINVLISDHPGASPRKGRVAFEKGLRQAHIVSLHCPLTPTTTGMICKSTLEFMRPDALLINTARGGLVNENDLISALKNGTIAGAALDVVSSEPPPENLPIITQAKDLNLIITPHIAWASQKSRQRLMDKAIHSLNQFIIETKL